MKKMRATSLDNREFEIISVAFGSSEFERNSCFLYVQIRVLQRPLPSFPALLKSCHEMHVFAGHVRRLREVSRGNRTFQRHEVDRVDARKGEYLQ